MLKLLKSRINKSKLFKILLVVSVLISPFLIFAASATLSQSGGELWTTGEQVTVNWTSSGVGNISNNTVFLEQVRDANGRTTGKTYQFCDKKTSSGNCNWTVGNKLDGEIVRPGDYRVRIALRGDSGSALVSTETFLIDDSATPRACTLNSFVVRGEGTITPKEKEWSSGSQSISISPASGFKVLKVVVEKDDEVIRDSSNSSNINLDCNEPADYEVFVSFTADDEEVGLNCPIYPIKAGPGGTVELLDPIKNPIPEGEMVNVRVIADNGYVIDEVVKKVGSQDYQLTIGENETEFSDALRCDEPSRGNLGIEATFKQKEFLSCESISPEETIADLRAGRPAQINKATFREWAEENEELVKKEIESGQCAYVGEPDASVNLVEESAFTRKVIRDEIQPLLDENKPALGAFKIIGEVTEVTSTTTVTRNVVIGHHAILITDMETKVISRPPRTIYQIRFIDPNDSQSRLLRCEDGIVVKGGRIIHCEPPPGYTVTDNIGGTDYIQKTTDIVLVSVPPISRRNSNLLSSPSVRDDAKGWIRSNYTEIDNYGTTQSPGGVCLGWSEFNAKASLLIKECPFPGDNSTSPKTQNPPQLNITEPVSTFSDLKLNRTQVKSHNSLNFTWSTGRDIPTVHLVVCYEGKKNCRMLSKNTPNDGRETVTLPQMPKNGQGRFYLFDARSNWKTYIESSPVNILALEKEGLDYQLANIIGLIRGIWE